MSGRSPPLYRYTTLITEKNPAKRHDEPADTARFCCIGSRIDWVSGLLAIKQITILLPIDKAGDKILLSENYRVNL